MLAKTRSRLARWCAALLMLAGLVCSVGVGALDAGAKMPQIGLQDLSGKGVDLAALSGKVVIVDF